MSLTILTALAVFVHLGTALAALLLKDRTDQQKIADINSKVDQVLGVVTAIAPALPTSLPKTLGQGLTDVAALAGALAPQNPPAPNSGGAGGTGTGAAGLNPVSGGTPHAG